jgi:hypothetical protein
MPFSLFGTFEIFVAENSKPVRVRVVMKSSIQRSIKAAACAGMLLAGIARPMAAGAENVEAVSTTTNHPTGPTLQLGYSRDSTTENLLADFMYFIPLISPEPVSVTSSARTNQFARVLSFSRKNRAGTFHVTCEFEIIGAGFERNLIDQSAHIQRRERQLKDGKPMRRLLASIDVKGPGTGSIEIDGIVADEKPVVNAVRFAFNGHEQASPISIMLEDIQYVDGKMVPTNEVIARVNTLTFQRKPGRPMMEVTIASVKPRSAKDTFWQNLKGSLKGGIANLFIPPLTVTAQGHETLLEFGAALASQTNAFTFPLATNILKAPGGE